MLNLLALCSVLKLFIEEIGQDFWNLNELLCLIEIPSICYYFCTAFLMFIVSLLFCSCPPLVFLALFFLIKLLLLEPKSTRSTNIFLPTILLSTFPSLLSLARDLDWDSKVQTIWLQPSPSFLLSRPVQEDCTYKKKCLSGWEYPENDQQKWNQWWVQVWPSSYRKFPRI